LLQYFLQDVGSSYQCKCPDGFTGKRCETVAVSCNTSPCKNGATCIESQGTYRCQCVPGYTGYNCDWEVNECGSEEICSILLLIHHGIDICIQINIVIAKNTIPDKILHWYRVSFDNHPPPPHTLCLWTPVDMYRCNCPVLYLYIYHCFCMVCDGYSNLDLKRIEEENHYLLWLY
jgi:hypothetical protein